MKDTTPKQATDVRVQAFLDAGITYDDAIKAVIWSVQHNDQDGAEVFAEVARTLLKNGQVKLDEKSDAVLRQNPWKLTNRREN